MTVNLASGHGSGGDAEGDVLTDIENLIGSAFADTLSGGGGPDTLTGGGGNDSLDGGAGTGDRAVYAGAWKDYTISFAASTYTISGSSDGTAAVSNVERFTFANGTFDAADTLNAHTNRPLAIDRLDCGEL